jgi:hypothetical protein
MNTDVLTCALIRLAAVLLFLSGIGDTTASVRDCLHADLVDYLVAFSTKMKSEAEAQRESAARPTDTENQRDTEANRRRVVLPPPAQEENLTLVKESRPALPGVFRPRTILLGFASIGAGICAIFWFFVPASISRYFSAGLPKEADSHAAVRLVIRVYASLMIAIPAFSLIPAMIGYAVLGIVELPLRVFFYAALPIGIGALLIAFNSVLSRLMLWRLRGDS